VTRSTRLLAVGLALTVLLGIVAFVSRGHVAPAGSGAHNRAASQVLVNVVFTLWALAMVAGTFLLLYALSIRRSARALQQDKLRLRPLLTVFFALGALALIVIGVSRFGDHNWRNRQPLAKVANVGNKLTAAERARRLKKPESPSFEWTLALGLIALIAGAGLTAFLRSKRRRSQLVGEITLFQELSNLLDETLDDLRNETDPRRAVIAAYARMERILAMHGLPRRPAEAPLEYLSRVLTELRVSEPAVRSLTNLFERAKFSQHKIGPEMKEEAIEALVSLRKDIRAIDKIDEGPQLHPDAIPRPAR
jgi:hypothetical protein